ncbi:ficolin-2-like [Ruditapes philippinarum]|uniref:ficolin-2-like n=1 Tax=Ruditapes philippinarum TaxID=129788 RepID=UPI00295AE9F5|nr:ficolin-2-like [Ruditapes philippinarum]
MIQNSTANMNNIMTILDFKKELSEVITILKDLKETFLRRENSRFKTEFASGCMELLLNGHVTSGIYTVFPETIWRPLKVFCDMETAGGGWTVFQRREDGSENFFRKWLDYSFGFGNTSGEFWLGNEFVYRVTHGIPQELRIELEDFDNQYRVASYGLFSIGSVDEGYELFVSDFEGNVTDSFGKAHNGKKFSTSDRGPSSGCSHNHMGGWWYGKCHAVNINGLYLRGEHKSYADGINWHGWRGHHYSLKRTEMKFRPK